MTSRLVLLAAGLGTRFGGPKQLEPVGPAGEPLFVLTATHALEVGFGGVVVVTRRALAAEIEAAVAAHLRGATVDVVLQDGAGPTRDVPWGTAHAVARCAGVLDAAFGVANADDYYGGGAIDALRAAVVELGPNDAVVVGYRLGDTLSPNGTVNRAVCRVDETGEVLDLHECHGLRRASELAVADGGHVHPLDAAVSMNLFGLGRALPARLAERFAEFAATHAGDREEMVLPDELAAMLAEGSLRLHLVESGGHWAGLTHRGDLDELRRVVTADVARRRA